MITSKSQAKACECRRLLLPYPCTPILVYCLRDPSSLEADSVWSHLALLVWNDKKFVSEKVEYFDRLQMLIVGLRPALEGFVVTMHEGACETGSQIPTA